MKFIIYNVLFEVTRRCNLKCAHCMRGDAQNINLDEKHVDAFFELNKFRDIYSLDFSGGEPTLNPNIIAYTVDKIINEKIPVSEIGLVTNGQIYSEVIVDAFSKFTDYRRQQAIELYTRKNLNTLLEEAKTKKYSSISLSDDWYHEDVKQEVKTNYLKSEDKINISSHPVFAKDLIKTGRSTSGKEVDYKIDLKYGVRDIEDCVIQSYIYLTANGELTTTGIGTFEDMDTLNMGKVEDMPLSQAIIKYGKADSLPITFSPNFRHLRKK